MEIDPALFKEVFLSSCALAFYTLPASCFIIFPVKATVKVKLFLFYDRAEFLLQPHLQRTCNFKTVVSHITPISIIKI